MTIRHTTRRRSTRLAALASAIVLLTAAAYMVVYIARWEWTRALISASVLIAMLSIVSTVLVLSRISELAALVRAATGSGSDGALPGGASRAPDSTGAAGHAARSAPTSSASTATAEALRDAGRTHADQHFAWLHDTSRTGVFIPVLLGAGMILSAIAWLVERLSGALAGATLDRRLADEIPLDLPLSDRPDRPVPIIRTRAMRSTRTTVVATAIAVLALVVGVEMTRRVTQSNEAENTAAGTTSIVLDVRSSPTRDATDTATVLWSVCARQLDEAPAITAIATAGRLVAFKVDRSLGRTAQRRVMGCLEDFTLDRVVAEVVDLRTTPQASAGDDDGQSTRSNLLRRWMPKFVSS